MSETKKIIKEFFYVKAKEDPHGMMRNDVLLLQYVLALRFLDKSGLHKEFNNYATDITNAITPELIESMRKEIDNEVRENEK